MAREEVARVEPRILAAGTVAGVLPQFTFNRTRTAILRAGGLSIGEHSLVMGPVHLSGTGDDRALFSIGSGTLISGPLRVALGARLSIGDNVYIGHDVALLTVGHEVGPTDRRCGERFASPIDIGNGVWIGSCVTILAGVRVGAGAVVAAGAVVTRDVPDNTLVAGVPAAVIRDLEQGIPSTIRHPEIPVDCARSRRLGWEPGGA
jgi:acetyltransferase-like isoleucine patch superfamily enzyme